MYLFNGVASAVSRVLTGYVCDTTRIQPRWIFQISLFLAGLIAVLVTLFHSYYELLVCFIFFGMMDGAATSSVCILALFTVSPEERAQGFGFFQFCVGLSLASGPPFGGTVYLWVKKNSTLFECQCIQHESSNWGHYFYVWDRHFTWSSEPREGLTACCAKRVPSFLSYFKTLSTGYDFKSGTTRT